MNEENDWDHDVEEDVLEGPVVCVGRQELVLQALHEMKAERALSLDLQVYHWM